MPSPPEPRKPAADDPDDLVPGLGVADILQQRPVGVGSVRHAVRIALAVTVSWAISLALSKSTFGLFAPVTTLLVVQTSPWTSLGVSIQRVLGTGLGVLLASIYVNVLGLTWWSFLAGVLVSLLIARMLPWSLGGQLQIPVAVVFVLALGPGTLAQDLWRVLDVVIGGLVGLASVFVFPERPKPDAFEAAIRAYRDAIVMTLRSIGVECGARERPLAEGENHDFVLPSRRLRDHADAARAALVRLAEGSQLNIRAGEVSSGLEGYALQLRRLSGIGVQVRGVVGAANRVYDRPGLDPSLTGDELRSVMEELVALVELSLGRPGTPVGSGDRSHAALLDLALSDRLRELADEIAGRRGGVGDVLASVSMLGRLDHIRAQMRAFPEWQA